MIFYLAVDPGGRTIIQSTQEAIKDVNDKAYTKIDIPTDKGGLMAWVQQMLDETLNAQPAPTPVAEVHPEPLAPTIIPPSLDQMKEFILDHANQREIESLYTSLGCRVGEIIRSARSEKGA